MSIGAAPFTVKKGEVVAVPVQITDVSGLYGFEAQLKFDPAVVRVADADPAKEGVQLLPGDFLALDFLVRNTADNDAGVLEFVLTQLNPTVAKSGSGTLFTVYFEGIAEGKTTGVTVDRLKLASRGGEEIPVTAANGEVRVAAAPSLAPASSPTPLPTAAQPLLDMDVLTATPASTSLVLATAVAAATTAPAATVTATTNIPVTAAARPTAIPATLAPSVPATPTATGAPAAPAVPEQPTAATTETRVVVAAVATSGRVAGQSGASIIDGTPGRSAGAAATATAPARTGLLLAGGGLIALAGIALAGVIILRNRARQS